MADKKPIITTTSTASTRPSTTVGTTAATARKETVLTKKSQLPLFEKENYTWMLIGGAIIALGFFLMAGGKNTDANTFDYNVVYSSTRITIAPILILIGLGVEIFAIFKRPKVHQHQ